MPVVGYVGLPGSGKTLKAVSVALTDLDEGREIYSNFRIGKKEPGYMVPVCERGAGCECWIYRPWRSTAHKPHEYVTSGFHADSQLDSERRRLYDELGLRRGRGFVADPRVTVLDSWEQVIAIRQARDIFDAPHRLKLVRKEGETKEGDPVWEAVPVCRHFECHGCSRGITVVLDELNLWAPSRFWQAMGVGVLNRWAYVRKDGLRIVWTAQHEARIDKVAREVTDFIWSCRSAGGSFRSPFGGTFHAQLFWRRKWIPALMTDANRVSEGEGARGQGGPGGMFAMETSCWIGPFGTMRHPADRYGTYDHVAVEATLVATATRAPKGREGATRKAG